MKSAIEIRKNAKSRKPAYLRRDSHKKIKIGKKWRKPRGHHNKFARHCNGTLTKLEVGYKSPLVIRGANRNGLFEIQVSTVKDLEKITDKKSQVVVIKRTVGLKKKIEIINLANVKGIKISNIRDTNVVLKKLKVKKETKKVVKEDKKEDKKSDSKEKPVVKDVKEEKVGTVKDSKQTSEKKEEPKKEVKGKNESK